MEGVVMIEAIKRLFSKKPVPVIPAVKVWNDRDVQLLSLNSRISLAFSRVRDDTNRLSQWVVFLNKRQDDIQERLNSDLKAISDSIIRQDAALAVKSKLFVHQTDLVLVRKENLKLQQWLASLGSHVSKTESNVKVLSEQLAVLEREIAMLKQASQIKPVDSALKILPRSASDNDSGAAAASAAGVDSSVSKQKLHQVIHDDTQLRDVIGLSSSEKSVLSVIYHSLIPITYSQISEKAGLNYGTVKNIICRLRKKHFIVEDQVNPLGEKEFFLSKKTKLVMSGR